MISRATVLSSWIAAALISSVAAAWAIEESTPQAPAKAIEAARNALAQPPSLAPVPAVQFPATETSIAELLGRSPFDEARRQFERGPIEAVAPVAPPRLLGVTAKGGTRSALIEWPGTGETQSVTVGTTTPQGVVTRIGNSDFVLKNGGKELVISMYD